MHALTRTVAALGAATLLILVVPLGAQADAPPYPPQRPGTWHEQVPACSGVTHEVVDGTFAASAPLQLSVTGASDAPTLALFTASQLGASLVSDADGGATIKLGFGPTARGIYEVTLLEPGTDRSSYGAITVTPAATGCAAVPTKAQAVDLAVTGSSIDVRVLWGAAATIGAGLLLWLSTMPWRRSRRARARER